MSKISAQGSQIANGHAYILGGISRELVAALSKEKPTRIDLLNFAGNLAALDGLVDAVEWLRIEGSAPSGVIRSLGGLSVFHALKRLEIVGRVKSSAPVNLPLLESCSTTWQSTTESFFALPSLRQISIKSYPGIDLSQLSLSPQVEELSLEAPAKLLCFNGSHRFGMLRKLRIFGASSLTSLDGLEATRLMEFNLERARQLREARAARECAHLRRLKLLDIAVDFDTQTLTQVPALEALHVAGKGVPDLPWIDLLDAGRLKSICGWWDSRAVSEAAIRSSVRGGRRIKRFEPFTRQVRCPLLVELGE